MTGPFWERNAPEVANSLMGLTLRIGNQKAIILHASPYKREEQQRGLYKPMLDMEAGQVYCPKLMSSVLLLITTGKGKTLGSCVRIDDIELNGIRYEGAGKVTSALGIITTNARGSAQIVDDLFVHIHLDAHPLEARREPRREQPKHPQGTNRKTLARLLPKIVEKYLEENPPISFEEYLNKLLEECKAESDLWKRIR